MHFTTDGTTPSAASSTYSSPISISKTIKLQAMAECPGGSPSQVTSATYTISETAASTANTPSFSKETGNYTAPFSVTISDASPCATVYYSMDGSAPTAASAVYTSPISISNTATLKAMAECPGGSPSSVASATYTILALTDSDAERSLFQQKYRDLRCPIDSKYQRRDRLCNDLLHNRWKHAFGSFNGLQQRSLYFRYHQATGDSGVPGRQSERSGLGHLHDFGAESNHAERAHV